MTITPEQLAEWRQLIADIPPAKWWKVINEGTGISDSNGDIVLTYGDAEFETVCILEFIAAAREAVPALIAEIERLRGSHCELCGVEYWGTEEEKRTLGYCLGVK